jgi:hypothetical protein
MMMIPVFYTIYQTSIQAVNIGSNDDEHPGKCFHKHFNHVHRSVFEIFLVCLPLIPTNISRASSCYFSKGRCDFEEEGRFPPAGSFRTDNHSAVGFDIAIPRKSLQT